MATSALIETSSARLPQTDNQCKISQTSLTSHSPSCSVVVRLHSICNIYYLVGSATAQLPEAFPIKQFFWSNMTGAWGVAVIVLLPVPLTFLTLLALPGVPKGIRRFILAVCRNVLALQTFGVLKLFHFMTMVSGITFASQVYATHQVLNS
jgi:hypothetical protein